jgi:hypothetical protein
MPMQYDPRDWYWIVGGDGPHEPFTGDDTRVFASARNGYVPVADATYVAWQAAQMAERGLDPTTRIDTEANLAAVLLPYGITANFTDLAP